MFKSVIHSSVCPPSPFGPASGVCSLRHTHTAHKERNIKQQSTRGVTELSVWMCHSVSDFYQRCVFFHVCVSVTVCLFSPPSWLPDYRYTGRESKGSSLPRLVGVQHYTQTHTHHLVLHTHTPVLQLCPISEWRSQ